MEKAYQCVVVCGWFVCFAFMRFVLASKKLAPTLGIRNTVIAIFKFC